MVLPREDAEFKTLEGLTIRGWLFPTGQRGPAMIMTPGFNMPKEAMLPDLAIWFQEHGINIFLYDPASVGASDGEPRNDIDARKQAEHLVDAVTWFKELPCVDPERLALWGQCFGGNVTLGAAAFDKRVKAVLSVAPLIDSSGHPDRCQAMLELVIHDRVSRLSGEDPMYLPYINEDGSVPNGLQMEAGMMPALERLGIAIENRVSVQTYTNNLSWNVLNLVKFIAPTPAMMVVPELDLSCPTEDQLKCFDALKEPKTLHMLMGKGHLDWMFGDIEDTMGHMLTFLKKSLDF